MRKYAILLAAVMLAAVFTGCARQEAPAKENAIRVSTVDEFLEAIGPDREICLQPGTYNLSEAATYGKPTGSLFYRWADVYDGYSLELNGVENLTIRGDGVEATKFLANDRWANILQLKKCHNISLSGFTAGHTQIDDSACAGSVLSLQSSEQIQLADVGLFGCGSCGMDVINCRDILLENSHIYSCSDSGMVISDSSDLTVQNCVFTDLGDSYGGYAVCQVLQGQNVRIQNCTVSGCRTATILVCSESQKVKACELTVSDCQFESGFQLDSDLTVDGISFANTKVNSWLPWAGGVLRDGSGKVMSEESLSAQFPDVKRTIRTEIGQAAIDPVISEKQEQITVSTVDEFLAAIGSNRDIIIKAPLLLLSDATDYGYGWSEYYFWADSYDGPELIIHDVENFSIHASSEDPADQQIHSDPRYANVLTFENCRNLLLSGFTAGHSDGEGSCTGGVLMFRNCQNVLSERCGLFGCGTLGVAAENCVGIQVKNCDIYECSYGGIQMIDCGDIQIGGCAFRDLGGSCYTFWNCENPVIDGEVFDGNYRGN